MAVQQKLMTVEEFWEQYAGKPYELINGEVVETVPAGFEHGAIETITLMALGRFVEARQLGVVVSGEVGFQLAPDVMRAADVAFITSAKQAAIADKSRFVPFAPDLAVEIISPGERPAAIQLKVSQYLDAGTLLVWLLYPDVRKIVVYDAAGGIKTLDERDTLDGGDILPGLQLKVAELFPSRK